MTKGSSVAGAEPTSRRLNKRGAQAPSPLSKQPVMSINVKVAKTWRQWRVMRLARMTIRDTSHGPAITQRGSRPSEGVVRPHAGRGRHLGQTGRHHHAAEISDRGRGGAGARAAGAHPD